MSGRVKVGDRVGYSVKFLRSTGQFTGDEAPCSWGPFARGILEELSPLGDRFLARVRWDNGEVTRVLSLNLARVGSPAFAVEL